MNLQIDFWQLVGMLGGTLTAVVAGVIGLARWLANEYDRRQEMRFADFKASSEAAAQAHAEALHRHMQEGAQDIGRISVNAERLSKVEASLGGHPTHKDIADMYDSINTLAGTVNQLVGETRLQSDLMRMLINREVSR